MDLGLRRQTAENVSLAGFSTSPLFHRSAAARVAATLSVLSTRGGAAAATQRIVTCILSPAAFACTGRGQGRALSSPLRAQH